MQVRNKDGERAGRGVEKTEGDVREVGKPSRAHLVLSHARLQFLGLWVRCPSPRAVPILVLPPALPLQLLELQVLVGTLGHIQLFLHLWADVQKGWRPEPLGLRGIRGWGQDSSPSVEEEVPRTCTGVLGVRGLKPGLLGPELHPHLLHPL